MAENKSVQLPSFRALSELVEFFDTHDMGEYWEYMPEAHFETDIKSRHHLVSVSGDLMSQLSEIARTRQVSVEILIDLWLREKVTGARH